MRDKKCIQHFSFEKVWKVTIVWLRRECDHVTTTNHRTRGYGDDTLALVAMKYNDSIP
jgi:hypothetical protein